MTMLPLFASSPCFAFQQKPTGKYLQSVYRKKVGGSRIEASADTVVGNARTRFMVEPSEEEGGLVHVRCCYNNKYWVPVQVQDSDSSRWIVGTADEPEEDLSSPLCTLFEPISDEGNSIVIRFLHDGTKKHVCVSSTDDKGYLQLRAEDDEEHSPNMFTVFGLSQHEALPKYVAFKGDNGKYLGTNRIMPTAMELFSGVVDKAEDLVEQWVPIGRKFLHGKHEAEDTFRHMCGNLVLQFHAEDKGDAGVIFTTSTNDDGMVRIMSEPNVFWKRRSDDWVTTGRVQNNSDPDALFEVVTGDDFVALRNLGNNKFCKRLGAAETADCLSACEPTISQSARLNVEEPVVRREIYDIKFHLDEARIYNKKNLKLVTEYSANDTSKEMKATFSYFKKTEVVSKWETTLSSKKGVDTKFNFGTTAGESPIIVGGEIAFSSESTSSQGQGESESNSEETAVTQEYIIPPRATVVAKFVGMRASCDVPYSYKQREVLTTGEKVTSTHNDGIYTVANNYNFGIIFTDDKEEVKKLQAQYY